MDHAIETSRVLAWLEKVADPEIPVLSIVDLGIVRGVQWHEGTCVVTITPTYSGCPALQEITHDIQQCLHQQGVAAVRVNVVLAPAWTTDWMTEKGRQALHDYGIAPPQEKAIDISGLLRHRDPVVVPCPLCGSVNTRLVSHFGSTACKALYRCMQCSEPFDYFKAH